MSSIAYRLTMAFLVGAFASLAVLSYFLFEPFERTTAVEPFPVLNTDHIVERGGTLLYRVDFIKTESVPVTSSNSLVCDNGLLLFPSKTTQSPPGSFTITAQFHIPDNAPLGKCRLVTETIAHVNFIKEVKGQRETEHFTITK